MQIPLETLQKIEGAIDMGLKCFIDLKTLEVIEYPDEAQFYGSEMEAWQDDIDKVDANPEQYLEIEKMNSTQSYTVMEDFINSLDNGILKNKLTQAIEGHKPFANFKHQIDQSGTFRDSWFAFKREKIIEWIREQLDEDFLEANE